MNFKNMGSSFYRQKCQKCQSDVRNVSWTSEMSVGRSDQIRSDQTVEKEQRHRKESHRKSQKYYILEGGEDITSIP